jgi:hypothetical protein
MSAIRGVQKGAQLKNHGNVQNTESDNLSDRLRTRPYETRRNSRLRFPRHLGDTDGAHEKPPPPRGLCLWLAVLAALSRVLLTGLPLASTLLAALSGLLILLAWFLLAALAALLLAALTGLRLLTTLVLITHERLLL